ncbi:MAG: S8 family serine peptidase [Bacillaceae bacterium]|nr:S8 family serine peptidase [Bacillaceae bacterium]
MLKGKRMLLSILSAALILSPVYGSAQGKSAHQPDKPEPVKQEKPAAMVNENGNKLFDNLEKKLQEVGKQDKLPVIIQFDGSRVKGNAELALQEKVGKFSTKYKYSIIDGIAATMTREQIEKLDRIPFVKQVEYDEQVQAFMGTADYWFGTEKARTDFSVDGDGDGNPNSYSKDDMVIAVIDTGIDPNHVDLDEGKIIGWKDYVNGRTSPYDDQGHGTHVASIAAGEGEGNSNYHGVAPAAALVGVKVLDGNGSGSMSDVTAGIDWAVQNKDVYGIEVLNLSLGTSSSSDGTDSTSQAVNNAVDAGLVVTVAAGNSGPATYTVGSPAAADKALTVGAAADPGENGFFLAYFSSRGPTADDRIKPDIVAPGYNITAAQAGTTSSYVTYSGTSMATPFTAGTVALILDANPSLSPAQVKNHLYSTAHDWGPAGKDIDYGNGMLDGYEAIRSAGGFSGTGIELPNHFYEADSLPGSGYSDWYDIEVTDSSDPIAVTLIMPDWTSSWFGWSTSPDFDIYLYDPAGNVVAQSEDTKRQETISFNPSTTGTYRLEVYAYSDSGDYFFDLSAGANSLTQTADNQ